MRELTLIDKALILKQLTLFDALDLDVLLAIAAQAHLFDLSADEPLFVEGQEGSLMYIVVEGEVILNSREGEERMGSHSYFGEESVFSDKPRSYSVKTSRPSRLLALSRAHLHSLVYECPSVAIALLNAYTSLVNCRIALEKEQKS
ncbi:MAG: cyclic nucleotide-binding domain-containing protein [Chlamydiia bacterium]|nr:cyclic nucleotide-binding domain-containing protein [Chlamydiia bacterium]